MNNTNPIFEALENLDENYAAEAILPRKKKIKKPLKFAIIAVAAVLALGTTAVAASSGEHPIMKLNYKQITADYDEYVNEDGWTVKTLTALEPYDDITTYRPVGRIRAYYADGDFTFYDELGININRIAEDTNLFSTAFKGDESDLRSRGGYCPDYMRSRTTIPADYSWVSYEEWVDPIKYVKYKTEIAQWERLSLQEKADLYTLSDYHWFDDFDGISHPTSMEHLALNGKVYIQPDPNPDVLEILGENPYNQYLYQGTPSEIYKLFGFTPLIGSEMTEEKGRCYAKLDFDYIVKKFTQGLYQYSLTDTVSGTPIEFTAWHYADLREAFTEHYGFDYEYIELNNGTQARLHRSITGEYIAEFEYNGAAYAFKTALDRNNVTRIMENLGILSV